MTENLQPPRRAVVYLVEVFEDGTINEQEFHARLKAMDVPEDELEAAQLVVSGELKQKDR